jgi:hypothetical protein
MKPSRRSPPPRKRSPTRLRFDQVKGKTVEFVEMSANADYPCVEIAFEDKTSLRFVMDFSLTMEPTYADWRTGNARLLRKWPAIECR